MNADDEYEAQVERAERVIAMLVTDDTTGALHDALAAAIAAETMKTLILESKRTTPSQRVVGLMILDAARERAQREARAYLAEHESLREYEDPS